MDKSKCRVLTISDLNTDLLAQELADSIRDKLGGKENLITCFCFCFYALFIHIKIATGSLSIC